MQLFLLFLKFLYLGLRMISRNLFLLRMGVGKSWVTRDTKLVM